MGIMEALPAAGSGVTLLSYCRSLFSCRAAVHAKLSTTEVKKMHAARGFRGIIGKGPRPPRDNLQPLMTADASTRLDLNENDGGVG